MMKFRRAVLTMGLFVSFVLVSLILSEPGNAQAPITSSGLGTQVSPAINLPGGKVQYDITGGYQPGGGRNLFHSFGDFNVPTNNIANFLNETNLLTSNILGRVTDGNPSSIFGTIKTTGFGNANLYLMNPAGIVFGPKATLAVGGSVNFTTANYIRLSDSVENAYFYANAALDAADNSILAVAPLVNFAFLTPAAFGFLEAPAATASITVEGGHLSVLDGQSITLVGRDVIIRSGTPEGAPAQTAKLSAPGGQIGLASTATPGEFLVQSLQSDVNLNGDAFTSFGAALLSPNSIMDLSHNGTSRVSIHGGQFVLTVKDAALSTYDGLTSPAMPSSDTVSLRNGSNISSVTQSSEEGPAVTLSGQEMDISIREGSVISSSALGGGVGGNITLDVGKTITVSSGGAMQAIGDFGSPSGTIAMKATDSLTLSGQSGNLTIVNSTSDVGANGGIALEAGKVVLKDGTEVLAHSFSDPSGPITVTGTQSVSISSSRIRNTSTLSESGTLTVTGPSITLDQASLSTRTSGPGDAGALTLHATSGDLVLNNATAVRSSSEQGSGRGGNIQANAAGSVKISGGSSIESLAFRTGPGGNIGVTAGQDIQLSNSSFISASSTSTTGNAGNITINAAGNFESSGGKVSTTATQAQGGDINITAGQDIRLNNNASVSASSTGPGNAGNIAAIAGDDFIMQNSSVTTQATQASGGNIKIGAADQIVIRNSLISASVMGGTGSGGNISIDPNAVILQNSRILAQAIQGNGGNISIITPFFLADQASVVSASSQFGLNGTVTIQSPTSNLSGSLGTLATKPRQAQSLLTQRCAALANGQASSFVVAGREQLPADPGGWLTSPLAFAGIDPEGFGEGAVAEGTSNLAPRTSRLLANGTVSLRRFTPAGFLMANYADSEATGCHS